MRGPNIPCQGYKGMLRDDEIDAHKGDLQSTWLVILGIITYIEPYSNSVLCYSHSFMWINNYV